MAADLARTAIVCKNAIDRHRMEAVLGFEEKDEHLQRLRMYEIYYNALMGLLGPKVTLCLGILKDGGVYCFGELMSFEAPTSLQSLPALVLDLKDLMKVMHAFETHRKKSVTPNKCKNYRPTMDSAIFKAIVMQTKDRTRQCHVHF